MAIAQLNGIEMYYESLGEGKALVLIMGLGGNVDWWGTGFRKQLARHRQIIALDNRGAGRTREEENGRPLTIEQMAEDIVALLDHIEIDIADVLGLSMGGMIAQELAFRYPNRVGKLILGCTSPGGLKAVLPTPMAMQLLFGLSQVDSTRSLMEAQMKLLFPDNFIATHQPFLEAMYKSLSRHPMTRENFLRQLSAIQTWQGTYNRLPNLQHKTLVLHGKEDILLPVGNAELFRQTIPDAKVVLYDDCGHGFAAQLPAQVMRDIETFLTNV